CPHCTYAAKFHSYQQRRVLTADGGLRARRAYYYCGRCRQSFLPYDEALGLADAISPGLLPLVCLAGTLAPFAGAALPRLRVGPSRPTRAPPPGRPRRAVRPEWAGPPLPRLPPGLSPPPTRAAPRRSRPWPCRLAADRHRRRAPALVRGRCL